MHLNFFWKMEFLTKNKPKCFLKVNGELLISRLLRQLRALAINLAVVVLPTPLIPVKRYAFGVLPNLIALVIV